MAVFAKAISNGYPMAAVIGKGTVMQAAQSTFISSTYWTERIGPAAAIATIRKHKRCDVSKHLIKMGSKVQASWYTAAQRAGLELEIGGIKPLGHFTFPGEQKQAAKTLFIQLMLEHGFLTSTAFYTTFAHQDHHLKIYTNTIQEVFMQIADAQHNNTLMKQLKGPVAHVGFKRLT
jgi:glutamate-1-semialdehyde 2,1-aminomutase